MATPFPSTEESRVSICSRKIPSGKHIGDVVVVVVIIIVAIIVVGAIVVVGIIRLSTFRATSFDNAYFQTFAISFLGVRS